MMYAGSFSAISDCKWSRSAAKPSDEDEDGMVCRGTSDSGAVEMPAMMPRSVVELSNLAKAD